MRYTLCWIEEKNNERERKWIDFINKEDIEKFADANGIIDYKVTINIDNYENLKAEKSAVEKQLQDIKNIINEMIYTIDK